MVLQREASGVDGGPLDPRLQPRRGPKTFMASTRGQAEAHWLGTKEATLRLGPGRTGGGGGGRGDTTEAGARGWPVSPGRRGGRGKGGRGAPGQGTVQTLPLALQDVPLQPRLSPRLLG